jgi:hypothetical protein
MCYVKKQYVARFTHIGSHDCRVQFAKGDFNLCRCGTDGYNFFCLKDGILEIPSSSDPIEMIRTLQHLKKKNRLVCSLAEIASDWRWVKGNEQHLHFIGNFNLGNTESHNRKNSDCDENSSDSDSDSDW